MRRNALLVSASLVMISSISGCSLFKKAETTSPSVSETDWYNPPVQQRTFRADPYPAYGSTVDAQPAAEPVAAPDMTLASSSGRYHTVIKKDTLYSLARTYYGNASRWKDIYEANAATISDPNQIRIGDRLLIP